MHAHVGETRVITHSHVLVHMLLWNRPGGADHAGQQRPLLLRSELHHTWSLKLLPDPLTLLQVIDEHELHADVLTVRHLHTNEHPDTSR